MQNRPLLMVIFINKNSQNAVVKRTFYNRTPRHKQAPINLTLLIRIHDVDIPVVAR